MRIKLLIVKANQLKSVHNVKIYKTKHVEEGQEHTSKEGRFCSVVCVTRYRRDSTGYLINMINHDSHPLHETVQACVTSLIQPVLQETIQKVIFTNSY